MANNREIFSKHYGLERGAWFYIILVLVEYAQMVEVDDFMYVEAVVLILVLVEQSQRAQLHILFITRALLLNPYFNGKCFVEVQQFKER